jgi:hypothetical protein
MYENTIKLLAEGERLPGFLSVGRIKVEIGTPISDGYFTSIPCFYSKILGPG